jgi:hypothetical protein
MLKAVQLSLYEEHFFLKDSINMDQKQKFVKHTSYALSELLRNLGEVLRLSPSGSGTPRNILNSTNPGSFHATPCTPGSSAGFPSAHFLARPHRQYTHPCTSTLALIPLSPPYFSA